MKNSINNSNFFINNEHYLYQLNFEFVIEEN